MLRMATHYCTNNCMVAYRRLCLTGHCFRHPEEIASQIVLWQLTGRRAKRGRKPTDFIGVIKRNTGLDNINVIQTAMVDKSKWKEYAKDGQSNIRKYSPHLGETGGQVNRRTMLLY